MEIQALAQQVTEQLVNSKHIQDDLTLRLDHQTWLSAQQQAQLAALQPQLEFAERERTRLAERLRSERQVVLRLKSSLKYHRYRQFYDSHNPKSLNMLLYYWQEYYLCRHYANGICDLTAGMCPYVHDHASPRRLLRDIEWMRKGYAGPFIATLHRRASALDWNSLPKINEMRRLMHDIAQRAP